MFILLFLLDNRRIRIHALTNGSGCGSGRPKNIWILRIRIRNTGIHDVCIHVCGPLCVSYLCLVREERGVRWAWRRPRHRRWVAQRPPRTPLYPRTQPAPAGRPMHCTQEHHDYKAGITERDSNLSFSFSLLWNYFFPRHLKRDIGSFTPLPQWNFYCAAKVWLFKFSFYLQWQYIV